jgi:hypothetical protein
MDIWRGCQSRWTSVEEEDPFVTVSGGRSYFRAADLVDLAALVTTLKGAEVDNDV